MENAKQDNSFALAQIATDERLIKDIVTESWAEPYIRKMVEDAFRRSRQSRVRNHYHYTKD